MSVARRGRRAGFSRLVANIGVSTALLAIFVVLHDRSPLAIVGIVGAALALSTYATLLILRLNERRRPDA